MRVTKLIKDYVEKKVSEIYDPRIAKVGAEYREQKEALTKQLNALAAEADAAARKLFEEAGFEMHCYSKVCIKRVGDVFNLQAENEISSTINALRNEKKEKIDDILLNLELGATRAELDEMLKNL